MKLISAVEFGSIGAEEMSLFQRLSAGNGMKPLRLPPWPGVITLQALGGGGGGGGGGALEVTCTFIAFDVLAPGLGFWTATEIVPAVEAVPVAVSFVAETKIVLIAAPANKTCAPLTKLLPLIVSERAGCKGLRAYAAERR